MQKGKNMKYLIIGTGGTGACIGGFLAADHKDVAFIARGKNLEVMKQDGLTLKSDIKGTLQLTNLKVFSEEEYEDKADVIFICVKSYSIDEIIPLIEKASHEGSILIPILNGYDIAGKISGKLKNAHLLGGCIYISSYMDAPGSVVQSGNYFRIVFGARKGDSADLKILESIKNDLNKCGIKAIISDNIERDTFKKYAFLSAYAGCAAYYDITSKEMQEEGEPRQDFVRLCEEITEISNRLHLEMDIDLTETNLKILDAMAPDTTASLQRDMKENKKTEMDGLLFEVVRLAEQVGADVPVFSKIAKHFKNM